MTATQVREGIYTSEHQEVYNTSWLLKRRFDTLTEEEWEKLTADWPSVQEKINKRFEHLYFPLPSGWNAPDYSIDEEIKIASKNPLILPEYLIVKGFEADEQRGQWVYTVYSTKTKQTRQMLDSELP